MSSPPASRGIGAVEATPRQALAGAGEVILPLPATFADVPLATSVRSTWLASSLRTVREVSGLPIEAYLAHLSPEDRTAMLGLVPGQWLPIALAMAHYRACDRLQLSNEVKVEIGFGAARHAHQSMIGVLLRAARASEGKKPSFASDLRYLAIGPVWCAVEWAELLTGKQVYSPPPAAGASAAAA